MNRMEDNTAVTAWQFNARQIGSRSFEAVVTAYCPCRQCCGKDDGITSSGKPARPGHTVAVDPRWIPLGTQIYLEEVGYLVAEDTGGAITGNRLDIFMKSHQEAVEFGIKKLRVYLLEEEI